MNISYQHHLFERFKDHYLVNYNLCIYETNFNKLVMDLCKYNEIGYKINGEDIPLCNLFCKYIKNYNSSFFLDFNWNEINFNFYNYIEVKIDLKVFVNNKKWLT